MRPLLLVSLSLAVLVGLVSVSDAALPSTKKKLIVPGESIGGATLGKSFAKAKEAWGKKKGDCGPAFGIYQCEYSTGDEAKGSAFLFGPTKKKVTSIRIIAGTGTTNPFNTPLAKFKTKKGIKLGSTQAQVEKAYKNGKTRPIPGGQGNEFFLKGPGKATTSFEFGTKGDNDPTQVVRLITIAIP